MTYLIIIASIVGVSIFGYGLYKLGYGHGYQNGLQRGYEYSDVLISENHILKIINWLPGGFGVEFRFRDGNILKINTYGLLELVLKVVKLYNEHEEIKESIDKKQIPQYLSEDVVAIK